MLLEWTAKDPAAAAYDGGAPRELFRVAQPFANHNGGQIALQPAGHGRARPSSACSTSGFADGGSGGDPFNLAQNLSSAFGKILRIDPLGNNSANGKYGIPAQQSVRQGRKPDTLGEIYAYGVRNPQRFSWDSKTGSMFVADIGQNTVEEISPVTAGANLGWNKWEGSFPYVKARAGGRIEDQRGEPRMTYPVVEYDHRDPLFQPRRDRPASIVYRADRDSRSSQHLLIFGDNPSGEIFYVDADKLPNGGQDCHPPDPVQRQGHAKDAAPADSGEERAQGKEPATRADLRFGAGPTRTDLRAEQARRRHPPARARRAVIAVRLRSAAGCRAPAGWRETR